MSLNNEVDELERPCYVMVNCDGRYWCAGGWNSKNYKKALVGTYYEFYEILKDMYEYSEEDPYEYSEYMYQKWQAIGIIPYDVMIKAEKLREESEEAYSGYLNKYMKTYFVNIDHYEIDLTDAELIDGKIIAKMIWHDGKVV